MPESCATLPAPRVYWRFASLAQSRDIACSCGTLRSERKIVGTVLLHYFRGKIFQQRSQSRAAGDCFGMPRRPSRPSSPPEGVCVRPSESRSALRLSSTKRGTMMILVERCATAINQRATSATSAASRGSQRLAMPLQRRDRAIAACRGPPAELALLRLSDRAPQRNGEDLIETGPWEARRPVEPQYC